MRERDILIVYSGDSDEAEAMLDITSLTAGQREAFSRRVMIIGSHFEFCTRHADSPEVSDAEWHRKFETEMEIDCTREELQRLLRKFFHRGRSGAI